MEDYVGGGPKRPASGGNVNVAPGEAGAEGAGKGKEAEPIFWPVLDLITNHLTGGMTLPGLTYKPCTSKSSQSRRFSGSILQAVRRTEETGQLARYCAAVMVY